MVLPSDPTPSPRLPIPFVPGWVPRPVVAASIGLHAAAFAAAAGVPSLLGWALGAVAANHALLAVPTLWPTGTLFGPNITRLPGPSSNRDVALTFDDGPDPLVTPAVLDMLDAHGVRATFFCIGRDAASHPSLTREIVRRGHLIGNHSLSHPRNFSVMFPHALRAQIKGAQDQLSDITGIAPRFFRAPMGFRSPLLDPVLTHLGLRLVTWTRRAYDTVAGNPATVLRRLCAGLGPGDILLMHDGNAARTRDGKSVTLAVLPALLDRLAASSLRSVTLTDAILAAEPEAAPLAAAPLAA